MIKDYVLKELNSKNYQTAHSQLKNLIKKTSLKDEDLIDILNLSNKLIVGEFLAMQPKFSKSNLETIEKFINKNLSHRNKLFVSDLIEFATDLNLHISIDSCIMLLVKHNPNNHFILMSTMEYVFFNLRISYIPEIVSVFIDIMNNKKTDTSARLKAAFYLYRFTYKKQYLNKIQKIIGNDLYNKDIVKNLMKIKFNEEKYFDGYNLINDILR